MFPEGSEGRGWAERATKLRKVQDFFARSGSTTRIGEIDDGGATLEKLRLVEEHKQTFAEVLTGQGHEKELDISNGDILGKKVMEPLLGNQAGKDHAIFP